MLILINLLLLFQILQNLFYLSKILIQYIQGPISASLQAMGNSKVSFNATLIGTISKLISLIVFSLFKIGLYGVIFGFLFSILLATYYEVKALKKALNN